MRHHPQVALTHYGEDRRIGDGVGGEVLELSLVVVEKRPHEAARGRSEPVAIELDEGNHVALRRARLPVFQQRRDPLRPRQGDNRMKKPLAHEILQPVLRHDRGAPVVGGDQLHRHDQ